MRGVAREITPRRVHRVVCYCDDCQAFAWFLERDDELDAQGGTEIWQLTPAQVRIEQGESAIRCMRLSSKGMYRWYAGCCKTPIANTMGAARLPFMGLIHAFIEESAVHGDAMLGAPRRFMGKFARGVPPEGTAPKFTGRAAATVVRMLARGALVGAHSPSPFFDRNGATRVAPEVLSSERRAALSATAR